MPSALSPENLKPGDLNLIELYKRRKKRMDEGFLWQVHDLFQRVCVSTRKLGEGAGFRVSGFGFRVPGSALSLEPATPKTYSQNPSSMQETHG